MTPSSKARYHVLGDLASRRSANVMCFSISPQASSNMYRKANPPCLLRLACFRTTTVIGRPHDSEGPRVATGPLDRGTGTCNTKKHVLYVYLLLETCPNGMQYIVSNICQRKTSRVQLIRNKPLVQDDIRLKTGTRTLRMLLP
jgi:hypothetical protein